MKFPSLSFLSLSSVQKTAALGIVIAFLTVILKMAAYFLTDSVSMLSDGLESLINLATSAIAFAMLMISALPADDNHPYGHDKAEYFSSGIEGALILVASLAIFYTAGHRFFHPKPIEQMLSAAILMLLTTFLNCGMAWRMLKVAKQHDSIALEADAKHLLADVWTSLGVVLGAVIMHFAPHWQIMDPLIACLIAANILRIGLHLLRRSVDGLMDGALPPDEVASIAACIASQLPQQASFSQLRTRKAGTKRFIDVILNLPGPTSVYIAHEVCDRIEQAIERQFPKVSINIHVEPNIEPP